MKYELTGGWDLEREELIRQIRFAIIAGDIEFSGNQLSIQNYEPFVDEILKYGSDEFTKLWIRALAEVRWLSQEKAQKTVKGL